MVGNYIVFLTFSLLIDPFSLSSSCYEGRNRPLSRGICHLSGYPSFTPNSVFSGQSQSTYITKYSYISNQKGVIIEVDNLVFLLSAAHSFGTIHPQQGLRFAHHLPMVCHSFGVWVTLSHHSRGYASLTTCLWSCQPFGLAFFSRASYKEYDSPCSSD